MVLWKPRKGRSLKASRNEKIQLLAGSVWNDHVKEDQLENILSEAEWAQFRAAREAGLSILQWAELYDDAQRDREKRTGKPGGSVSQEEVRAALEKSGLPEKKREAVWKSYMTGYGWTEEWEE